MEIHKTALAMAIEQRERKLHEFEVHGFFGLGNKQIRKVGIRVATKADEDNALVAAHAQVNAATNEPEARKDFDLIADAKLIHILYRVCFSTEEKTDKGVHYPAFVSPNWMREFMTTDQIAVLMNLYHEVRQLEAPGSWDIDNDRVEALAAGLSASSDTDLPEALLADLDRTWITHAFVMLACKYKELQDVQCGREDGGSGPGASEDEADDDAGDHADSGAGGGSAGA